jgi:outer membrane protein assembly factor BamD
MKNHKVKNLSFLAICILLFSITCLKAELIWQPGEGWSIKGGALETYFTESGKDRNAIELMNSAKAAQEKGNLSRALSLYKKVFTQYKNSILAPEALFQTGKMRFKKHQYKDAFYAFNKIVARYPEYEHFNEVLSYQFEIASDLMHGKRPHYWGVIPGFKDYDEAIKCFEKLVKNAPFSPHAPRALLYAAELNRKEGKPEAAIDALDRLISNYPYSSETEKAYLELAEVHLSLVQGPAYDQGSTREAISCYQDFLILYPHSTHLKQAEEGLMAAKDLYARSRIFMGDFYYKYRDKPKAALLFYNQALTLAANETLTQEARQRIQLIRDQVPPPKTPVDFLFGRYLDAELEK